MTETYRRSFEKVDRHPVQGFIDREGRWWSCRCADCGLCDDAAQILREMIEDNPNCELTAFDTTEEQDDV